MAEKSISRTVPIIKPDKAYAKHSQYVFLDARENAEYAVSHIAGALQIGYNFPDFSCLKDIPKNQPIVVYCSVGYRSEKMAEKLISLGYKKVYNLYGGIFSWSNSRLPLVDTQQKNTLRVHGYNKSWGIWLNTPEVVYE